MAILVERFLIGLLLKRKANELLSLYCHHDGREESFLEWKAKRIVVEKIACSLQTASNAFLLVKTLNNSFP